MLFRFLTLSIIFGGLTLSAGELPYTLHADLIYSEAGGIPQEIDLYLPKEVDGPTPGGGLGARRGLAEWVEEKSEEPLPGQARLCGGQYQLSPDP